jgi:glycosyltransferase involved in cell wall biosynthesis
MRVAQIIDGLRLSGGAERLQLLFAEAVADTDVELTVVTLRPGPARASEALEAFGARVVEFPAKRFAAPTRALRLARFLRREAFDVVHTHLVRSTILGTVAGRVASIPTVATLHNTRRSRHLPATLHALEAVVLRHATDRVVAVGWETARAHEERLHGRTIEVIPNPVGRAYVLAPGEREAVRAELGVRADELLVIGVGRLHPQKAFDHLINAVAIAHREGNPVQLRIAGDGRLEASLRAEAERLGIGDRVGLLGLRRDVPRLLAAADVYASSSEWEGLPVATLEAMAAGLPVVATAVGDVAHVVDPSTGTLVPPGRPEELARALCKVLCDPMLRRAQGEAGRLHVDRHHDVQAWSQRHLDLYRELGS